MTVLGFGGGLLHVLNHSLFKSLLFMGAGMVIQKTGTKSIDALGGLLKKMKITGITFLIGSLAISGLPPFNGFVSEFFIYLGGFKGVGLDRTAFILSHLAIISLAIIGGLALACFTKVMGVVFQGEPRKDFGRPIDEKEPMMIWPMIILAGICTLIGVFPGLFIAMTLKGISSLVPGYAEIPLEPFFRMTNNITLGAVVFLVIFILLLILRFYLYKNKTITASGTWGCGFTQPTPKMQYTGVSFAASIIDFFKPIIPHVENHPCVTCVFPKKTHYHSHVNDLAEIHMEKVIVKPVLALFDKLRWIQHGDIHLYIGYILLTIVILLFFV
jgi:hydrogenase-4 component B